MVCQALFFLRMRSTFTMVDVLVRFFSEMVEHFSTPPAIFARQHSGTSLVALSMFFFCFSFFRHCSRVLNGSGPLLVRVSSSNRAPFFSFLFFPIRDTSMVFRVTSAKLVFCSLWKDHSFLLSHGLLRKMQHGAFFHVLNVSLGA